MSETESIELSTDAVEWLEALAREPGFVSANDLQPCECFRPLVWMGLVEHDGVSFRLSDLGRWALTTRYIVDVGR